MQSNYRRFKPERLSLRRYEEQEEELTRVCTAAAEQPWACREEVISSSNVQMKEKTDGGAEEEAEER
jgi:hypothetical protein